MAGVLFVCGGLWAAMLLDENLDEMFENQDPLRPGDVPGDAAVLSLPELLLVKLGRIGICLGVVGVVVGEGTGLALPLAVGMVIGDGAAVGLGGASRTGCDKDRCRVVALSIIHVILVSSCYCFLQAGRALLDKNSYAETNA